jgi:uncharacterized protein
MSISPVITDELIEYLREKYVLNWNGIHGFSHWMRVRANGLMLAEINGANRKVVEYFAFIHDNQRRNDGNDHYHGRRACQLIQNDLQHTGLLDLTDAEIALLCEACEGHTYGRTEADLTVQTCWDADRLDLMRAGIRPSKRLLCTDAAKDDHIIDWAVAQSFGLFSS